MLHSAQLLDDMEVARRARVVRFYDDKLEPEEEKHQFDPRARARVIDALLKNKFQRKAEIAAKAGFHPDYVLRLMKTLLAEGIATSAQIRVKTGVGQRQVEAYKLAMPDDPLVPVPTRPGMDARPLAACFGGYTYRSGTWQA